MGSRLLRSLECVPVFEMLESRQLLSGDVIATITAGGNLVITGDNLDNSITIDQKGLAAGQVKITGTSSTTVNGSVDPVILSGLTGKTKIQLAGGNDTVLLDSAAMPGKFDFDGGAGNNELTIDDATVGGNLTFKNKDGNQTFSMSNTSEVNGGLSIKNKDGDSTVVLDDVVVIGRFQVTNKAGDDQLTILDSLMRGDVKFNAGNGATTTLISGSAMSRRIMLMSRGGFDDIDVIGGAQAKGMTKIDIGSGGSEVDIDDFVGTSLDLRSMGGNDTVTMADLAMTGKVKIQTGDGTDILLIDDVDGEWSIKTGSGNDALVIETSGAIAGLPSTFTKVSIDTGENDDSIVIGWAGEAGNTAIFNGPLKINGGNGSDQIDWIGHGNAINGNNLVISVETII